MVDDLTRIYVPIKTKRKGKIKWRMRNKCCNIKDGFYEQR